MSEPITSSPPPRRSNVVLIVSLCLNVALIGMITIGIVNAIRFRTRMHLPGPLAPQALMHEASSAERAKIQSVIDAHLARFRELRLEAMEARMAAFHAFTDPGFSVSNFENALERVHQADSAVQDEAIKITAESAAQLSPAERKAVADKIRARRRRGWFSFYSHRDMP